MNRLVSVIIPAYNPGELIRETINSVISQTYSDLEIVIVDDGSTDNTPEVIRSINDSRIRYHRQPNTGLPAQVRNKGVALSRGGLIAFLDHDDVWMPEKLEMQIAVIEDKRDIALICTNAFYMYDGKKTDKPLLRGIKSGYLKAEIFVPRNAVIQSSILVTRSGFDRIGGLNESPDFFAIEDYDFWLRVCGRYPCYYVDKPAVYYRKITDSASGKEVQVLKRSLQHYNKYFSSYEFPKRVDQARLFEILKILYSRYFFMGDKQCGECLKTEKLPIDTLVRFLFWITFSTPSRIINKISELIEHGTKKKLKK